MKIADMFATLLGPESRVAVAAYDGSAAGPANPVATIKIKSPAAVQYIATAPGDLGLARAYISGELDVTGDLHAAVVDLAAFKIGDVPMADKVELAKSLG
ncbi:MAG: hypothetical protein RLZ55_1588, partial [Actinomycetota bacterium]